MIQLTLADMNGSLALARDTAHVATAAVRLSQVVGALEYQSESQRLKQNQQALQHSLTLLASAPLAARQPERIARIRALAPDKVRALVAANTDTSFFGEPRVNVLAINRALDATPR